ncbi:MAG TPA: substrate-binding domain-containing protein [Firmicutes bacterium]|nr:substrate-binding domain-containing protein [Bacillota bacterium]
MKTSKKVIFVMIALVIALTAVLAACGGEKDIAVIARTSGSGTRDAFESIVKSEDGTALKDAGLMKGALEQDKTSTVISLVSSTETGIGYVSLGSVDDSVKVLKVEGVEATAENVLSGDYKMQRPFVIMTSKAMGENLTAATKDFLAFLRSTQAQDVVEEEGYVRQDEGATEYTAPASAVSGTVSISGSTSVDPLMDKLIGKYKEIGGASVAGVEISKNCQGTSHGISAVKADKTGNVIGLGSSAVKEADEAEIAHFEIALDAIAVIVNPENTLEDITIAQLFDIYTGKIVKFSALSAA